MALDDDSAADHDIDDDGNGSWSLDDLERSADLGTLRSAWAAADDGEH